MVRVLRQVLSLALIGAVALLHAQAAALHVHAAIDHAMDSHGHGPASHHHDVTHQSAQDTTQIAALEPGDTVIAVRVVAASTGLIKPMLAPRDPTPSIDPESAAIVDGMRIVARAHGPPSTRQPSLRAPPAFSSL